MRFQLVRLSITVLCGVGAVLCAAAVQSQPAGPLGEVQVAGNRLIRDGRPWIPHGFYQIAFEVPPGVPNTKRFWLIASRNYSPEEYVEMRRAGADSVRIQVAQPGMDPKNRLFRSQFRDQFVEAVRAARVAGLCVS